MTEITPVLRAGALNGETPLWCPRRRRLFWVDIRAFALHAFDPATGTDEQWEMPAWPGSIGLTQDGLLVALRTGLWHFTPETGALAPIAAAPCDPRRFALNDGRCDPAGRFLIGTMYAPNAPETEGPTEMPLWRHDGGTGWTALTEPVRTSNGLAWSPDGRRMYHADTRRHTIWCYDYDPATGTPTNRRVFARVEEGHGPDGASVDRDGFYWCAVFGAGCLLRLDPEGRLERRIDLPIRYPTMPAFGGDDLATIFVTSANNPIPPEERARHPLEGGLFALPAPVPGLPNPVAASP